MQASQIASRARSLDRGFHQDLDRLFRDVFGSKHNWPGITRNAWSPPTDVYETETDFVVQMEISGLQEGDFRTTFENGVLTVRGVRADEAKAGRKRFRLMEINRGYFERSIVFEERIDGGAVKASYKDGFLKIVLPKLRGVRKSVSIEAG